MLRTTFQVKHKTGMSREVERDGRREAAWVPEILETEIQRATGEYI